MGLFSDLGLSAARTLRTRVGARGALRALSPLIAASEPSAARAAAVVVALECALELGDDGALEALALFWGAERAGARTADVARLCAQSIGSGRPARAERLAAAEVTRQTRPESLALRAVAREASGATEGAIEDWRSAASEADRRGDAASARAARVELARLLATQPGRRLEAARVASAASQEPAPARAQLLSAAARLGEPGRYARVRGLDELAALARHPDAAVARSAIRAACAHVDASGAALTSVELDRVRSIAAAWPEPLERARLTTTLETLAQTLEGDAATRSAALVRAAAGSDETRAQLARARAVLSGDAPGPRPAREGEEWVALAAIAALRRGRDAEARSLLHELAGSEGAVDGGAPAAWTAAWMALDRTATRGEGALLAGALLATPSAPPRGFLALATHLERAGEDALVRRSLARAEEQREPGARARRVEALVRAAWRAHREGRRDDALRWLREAKG